MTAAIFSAMLRRPFWGAVALCAALVMFNSAALAATARVPIGFVGVNVDGPGFPASPGVNLNSELRQMKADGVQRVRVIVSWAESQPYASDRDIPSGEARAYVDESGVPTTFAQTDALVSAAAAVGIKVLPTVLYAPSWDSTGASTSTLGRPAATGPYAAFLTDLVKRYGPHGTFWKGTSGADAITQWEIWNEPNIPYYWPTRPFAASYVALLRAAHTAVKRADPTGQVVLAGLTGRSWNFLEDIYKVKGARGDFDVVASHPYTENPAGVITILHYDRIVMDNYGDRRKPLVADEVGWTSSQGHVSAKDFDMGATEYGQAAKDAQLLGLLGKNRASLGLAGFDIYTWASTDTPGATSALGSPGFNYAGLEYLNGGKLAAKPALAAFRKAALALER